MQPSHPHFILIAVAFQCLACASPLVNDLEVLVEASVFVESAVGGEELVAQLVITNGTTSPLVLSWGGCNPGLLLQAYTLDSPHAIVWSEPRVPEGSLCTLQVSELAIAPGERRVAERRLTVFAVKNAGLPTGVYHFAITPTLSGGQIPSHRVEAGPVEIR